jgi:hypothetical protein
MNKNVWYIIYVVMFIIGLIAGWYLPDIMFK